MLYWSVTPEFLKVTPVCVERRIPQEGVSQCLSVLGLALGYIKKKGEWEFG